MERSFWKMQDSIGKFLDLTRVTLNMLPGHVIKMHMLALAKNARLNPFFLFTAIGKRQICMKDWRFWQKGLCRSSHFDFFLYEKHCSFFSSFFFFLSCTDFTCSKPFYIFYWSIIFPFFFIVHPTIFICYIVEENSAILQLVQCWLWQPRSFWITWIIYSQFQDLGCCLVERN